MKIKMDILRCACMNVANQLYCEVCHKLKYTRSDKQKKCECKDVV